MLDVLPAVALGVIVLGVLLVLLFAVVVGPWMLAGLLGHGAWSIPGAIEAVLDFTLRGGQVPT